jgi:hypothetical protein
MLTKLKGLWLATLCSAALMVAPTIGEPGSATGDLFGVTSALAGNGNGNGNAGGHGTSGNHGGQSGNHGKSLDTGTEMKTAHGKSGQSGSGHGKSSGFAQSFVDSVGKGVGKASHGVQSMFDGVFGGGHSKGKSTASIQTTPEDVPTPTGRPEKSRSVHADLRSLSSLGRSEQAYVHSQSPLMTEMRSYIENYMDVVDAQGVEAAKTDPDLQQQLADIVSKYGAPSATTTETAAVTDPAAVTTDPAAAPTTTIDPAVADYISGVLGDGSEGSKMADIRGMLDDQAATDSTATSSTASTAPATDPALEDNPAPAE